MTELSTLVCELVACLCVIATQDVVRCGIRWIAAGVEFLFLDVNLAKCRPLLKMIKMACQGDKTLRTPEF